MCSLAVHSLEIVRTRQRRREYDSEVHIILVSFDSLSYLDFQFQATYSFCIYIYDAMSLINLNFIQFYRLLVKVDLIDKRSSTTSIDDVFVICENKYALMISRSNNEWNERIDNNNLMKIFDLIDSSSENPFNLFYKQASALKSAELCVEGNIHRLWLWWAFNNSFKYFEQIRSQWMRWRERQKPFIRQRVVARCWRSTRVATNELEIKWCQECEYWQQ